jgi:hypothetical protein
MVGPGGAMARVIPLTMSTRSVLKAQDLFDELYGDALNLGRLLQRATPGFLGLSPPSDTF